MCEIPEGNAPPLPPTPLNLPMCPVRQSLFENKEEDMKNSSMPLCDLRTPHIPDQSSAHSV